MMSFNSNIFMFIFIWMDGLSVAENGVLKTPTIFVLLIFWSMPKRSCFIVLGAHLFSAYVFKIAVGWSIDHDEVTLSF